MQDAVEKDSSHLIGQRGGAGIDFRPVPGVSPVHHAEQAEHGQPRVQPLQAAHGAQLLHYVEAGVVVAPLQRSDFRLVRALQRVGFVREYLHAFAVLEEVPDVVADDGAYAPGRIVAIRQPLFQASQQRFEGVFLDLVEKLFLASEVVVEAGQAAARGAGDVANGGGGVALVAEDVGGVCEDFRQAAVVAPRGSSVRGCSQPRHATYRTFVLIFSPISGAVKHFLIHAAALHRSGLNAAVPSSKLKAT